MTSLVARIFMNKFSKKVTNQLFSTESMLPAIMPVLVWLFIDLTVLIKTVFGSGVNFTTASYYYMVEFFKNYFWSFLKVQFLAPFALFIILWFLFSLLQPKNKWLASIGFTLHAFFVLAVRNPQLLQDIDVFSSYLRLANSLSSFLVIFSLIFLSVVLFPTLHWNHKRQFFIRSSIWFLTLCYLIVLNNPFSPAVFFEQQITTQKNSNVILVGIDGFDPLIAQEFVDENRYPYFTKFVKSSKVFNKSYTEIARTEPALNALLSGIAPHNSSVRSALLDTKAANDLIGTQEHIVRWRDAGGKIKIRLSDTAYINFNKSEWIDSIEKPVEQVFSFFAPHVLRTKIFFAYFNIPWIRHLFPEVLDNAAFQDTYDTRSFLEHVRSDISKFDANTLYLAHLTKLHWPGSFPYPYYIFKNRQDVSTSDFSYSSMIKDPFVNTKFKFENTEFNLKLYRRGHEMILDLYLEPLLQSLYQAEVIQNSTVVIYSDHSEAFFVDDVPNINLPTHGSWMPERDNSYHNFLAVHQPGKKSEIINTVFQLHKILPMLLSDNQSEFESNLVFDTGWWPGKIFTNEFHKMKPSKSNFQISQQRVFSNVSENEAYLRVHPRTIFWNDNYYSLIVSTHGFFWFCSDAKQCELAKAWDKFRTIYAQDFASKLIPQMKIEHIFGQRTAVMKPDWDESDVWHRSLHAMMNLYSLKEIKSSRKLIESYVLDKGLPMALRSQLLSAILYTCSLESEKIIPFSDEEELIDIFSRLDLQSIEGRTDLGRAASCWAEHSTLHKNKTFRNVLFKAGYLGLGDAIRNIDAEPSVGQATILPDQSLVSKVNWPFWVTSVEYEKHYRESSIFFSIEKVKMSLSSGQCIISNLSESEQGLVCGN